MCVQIAISHVSQTLWEHERCWHFQLTANSCFWVMSTTEANGTGCSRVLVFFFFLAAAWEGEHFKRSHSAIRRQAQRSNILWFPAAKHSALPRASNCREKDPVRTLWASQLQIHRSAHFNWSAHYFRTWKEKWKHRLTSAWECVYCLLYSILSFFRVWSFWDNWTNNSKVLQMCH